MALSRPIYNLLGFYFEQLFENPIRTKSITSCVIATSAKYVSMQMEEKKGDNEQSLIPYSLFGLLFGGTVPHYFYKFIDKLVAQKVPCRAIIQFLMERLLYMPAFQMLSLYSLARFEGKDHRNAVKNLLKLYRSIIVNNWKYLSLFMFINITFVPPMLRVLVGNVIGFCWIVFVAKLRQQSTK